MFKKLAMLAAAAGLLYVTVPTTSASAQGINVQIGGGGSHGGHRGYHRGPGYHRGHGYRGSRAYYGPRHGHRHGHRGRTIIVR